MGTRTILGAGVLVLAVAACGKSDTADPYLASVPDAAGLTLELQGGAAEGLAATSGTSVAATALTTATATATATAAATPVTPDDLADARARIKALNEAVRDVFARVEEIASTGGRELPGNLKIYGPADRCVEKDASGTCLATANLRLAVRMPLPNVGAFALEARPVGSTLEADFHPVLAGYLVRAEVARRGHGKLWVNMENMVLAAGTAFKGRGYLVAGFASGPVVKAATYRMLGFTRDLDLHPPVIVAFSGFKTPTGTARVRVAAIGDFDTSGPDTELGLGRLVYNPALGGRAFGIVRNYLDWTTTPATPHGDVPAGQYWFGRACYAPNAVTPAFKEWFLCPVAQSPVECLVALGGTWVDAVGTQVAGNAGDTWKSTCALPTEPAEMGPPPAPPSDDPSDATPEQGQTATGLTPDAVPADPMNPDLTPPA